MPERLTKEVFTRQLKTKFRVLPQTEGAPVVELELDEVVPFPTLPHSRSDVERFSAFFYGPADHFLPQMTYRMEHGQLGELDVFLVPVASDQRGLRYEAVYSYFTDDEG